MTAPNVSLETVLAGLSIRIPLISAAMTSVTDYEMAVALGKEGGLGVLPARLSIEDQASIVNMVKRHEMGFVEDPLIVHDTARIEDVLKLNDQYGHSKIPIIDKKRKFVGMFELQHYRKQRNANSLDAVTSAMIPFGSEAIPYCNKPDVSITEALALLGNRHYLVVLDEQQRLEKMAFQKDIENIPVGAAISTYEDWKERVQEIVGAGVDLIVIDTSDAHSEFVSRVISDYKAMNINVPLCAGNIVTYEGARFLMEAGADIVKVGMSSGSICTTRRQKAVGRAPMAALQEAERARKDYKDRTGKYVSVIMDGGIATAADMVIALTMADAVMLGGYLNHFYEASGEKLDKNNTETRDEEKMAMVATWGEGSARANNLGRYGHTSPKTFFTEGVESTVPYRGRLKPRLREDLWKIRSALSNAGCQNLKQFREESIIEVLSRDSQEVVGEVHNIQKR